MKKSNSDGDMVNSYTIVIVGLGYVGLPLAALFAKNGYKVIGYDINPEKIEKLSFGEDYEGILSEEEQKYLKSISFVSFLEKQNEDCFYVVTVPTPIDSSRMPDLSYLIKASESLGDVFKVNDIVVYESTVYPGATRSLCIPIIVQRSNQLSSVDDVNFGYSPERINPSDRINTVESIIKVVSGSDPQTTDVISKIYSSIIKAGVHICETVEEAEASKIMENTQRDVNIALMNEFDDIFYRMDINIYNVIRAASTKWNFLTVTPGLVGGHCIGVDPYYMISEAKKYQVFPVLIEAARKINEEKVDSCVYRFLEWASTNCLKLNELRILFFGMTFKPNCADMRNSKNYEAYISLGKHVELSGYDPFTYNCEEFTPDLIVIGADHDERGWAEEYFSSTNVLKYYLI